MTSGQHIDKSGISWPMLAVVAAVAIPLIIGALKLGAVQNQVENNTARVDRIEGTLSQVTQHNADTLAREGYVDKRLDRLESK